MKTSHRLFQDSIHKNKEKQRLILDEHEQETQMWLKRLSAVSKIDQNIVNGSQQRSLITSQRSQPSYQSMPFLSPKFSASMPFLPPMKPFSPNKTLETEIFPEEVINPERMKKLAASYSFNPDFFKTPRSLARRDQKYQVKTAKITNLTTLVQPYSLTLISLDNRGTT